MYQLRLSIRTCFVRSLTLAFVVSGVVVQNPWNAVSCDAQEPAGTTPSSASGVTIILIAERRTASEAAKRDDLNSLMKEALNTVFKDSGQYTVHMFSPSMAVLKQALLTHTLEITDLDEPVKPASLHRMAQLLGARNIVTFHSAQDRTGIKTDVTFEEIAAQDTWRATITNQYHTASIIGKRKLKLDEMVDVNVDSIAKSLGVKSHLLDDLHLEVAMQPMPAPSTTKPQKSVAQTPNPSSTSTATNGVPTKQNQTTAAVDPPPTPATTVSPQDPIAAADAYVAGPAKKQGKSKRPSPLDLDQFKVPGETPVTVGDGAQQAASGLSQPGILENITNAARAQRYRQSGDLASTILYLRHAVDDKPDDVDLRRQLIQAYQDDKEPNLAVAEIGRSLRLDSKNSTMFRLYGDAQSSDGKLVDAIKAYRQAVELDPKDVLARVALGDTLQRDGQLEAALQEYHEAVTGAPTSSLPHRRLARAACQRASADPDQYAQALAEIKKARSLTAPIDTQTYFDDYIALMKIMESRIVDILDQVDNSYAAFVRGQSGVVETNRVLKDMSERATAASDFLDGLPVAAGQEGTHAMYQEGTASVLSSIIYLKSYVPQRDTQFESKLKIDMMSARHDLTAAGKKLRAAKAATEVN